MEIRLKSKTESPAKTWAGSTRYKVVCEYEIINEDGSISTNTTIHFRNHWLDKKHTIVR